MDVFCLVLNLLRPLFLLQTFMKLYTEDFIEVMNNDWEMVDLYGSMQIIYYEDIGAAAHNNSHVFGTKEEAEQFQYTPSNLLELGQKYLLINSVKSCKEMQ